MREAYEDAGEAVRTKIQLLQDGREKTAEFGRTNRIWLRENPISETMERNKRYLAINSHLKEPKIHAGDERTTCDKRTSPEGFDGPRVKT